MRFLISVSILVAAVLVACGEPNTPEDDAGGATDAGRDAFVGVSDAGADGGEVPDAGEPDSGTPDSGAFDGGTPDAGPEPCSAEGMYRTAACACEGTVSQRCTGGVWTNVTACSATPMCEPGEFITQSSPRCSVIQRVCGSNCQWGEWETVVPRGECDPGEVRCSALSGECRCNDRCECELIPECPVIP